MGKNKAQRKAAYNKREEEKAKKALQVLKEKELAKQLFVTGFVKGGTHAG